jgi:hypothetical protein
MEPGLKTMVLEQKVANFLQRLSVDFVGHLWHESSHRQHAKVPINPYLPKTGTKIDLL